MYSQRDSRWANIRLGTSTRTIGQDGCLLCCAADLLRSTAHELDPARLNRWLVNNGGFVDKKRFVFDSLRPFDVRMVGLFNWGKALADIPALLHLWEQGFHLLIEINFTPWGKFTSHWVSVLDPAGDFEIFDPWLTPDYALHTISLLATYARPEQDLARAIYRAVAYEIDEIPF